MSPVNEYVCFLENWNGQIEKGPEDGRQFLEFVGGDVYLEEK